ncbi:MAG: hypothetical protein GXY40_07160 [Syntrophomonadaceae bacterium]|nr:hypothetical protein [Syntrophomonadaceae bacterium]
MSDGRVEQVRDTVIGLRPVYTERGNATELWLASGETLMDRRGVKSTLMALARSYAVDLKAQRRQLEQLIQRNGVFPFYLGSRVFVPIKMRQAITENDSVYGYLDSEYIMDIKGGKGRGCRLLLTTGDTIEAFSSRATALKSWYLGLNLHKELGTADDNDQDEQIIMQSVLTLCRNLKEMAQRLERIEEHIAEAGTVYHSEKNNPDDM